MNKSLLQPPLLVLAVLAASVGAANAVGPDFTALTTAVDFTTVGAAILAIAGLKVVPKVIVWGASRVVNFIGR